MLFMGSRSHATHESYESDDRNVYLPPLLCSTTHDRGLANSSISVVSAAAPGRSRHLVHRPAPRPRGRDPDAQETKKSSAPGALLPRSRTSRTSRTSSATASSCRAGRRRATPPSSCSRRPLHGRDGQDPEPDPESRAAGPRGRLLARGRLPARRVPGLRARSIPAPCRSPTSTARAAVKALSDIICTSSERREDRPLDSGGPADPLRARPSPRRVPVEDADRPMMLWPGACIVHEQFSERRDRAAQSRSTRTRSSLAHPECEEPCSRTPTTSARRARS